jgi:hypothetical protein
MSRYRIDEPIPISTTAHIYGPDGKVIGQIYRADDTESLRLKRFIEAHDEIVTVLRQIAEADGRWLVLQACTDNLTSIINRIDGKEAV